MADFEAIYNEYFPNVYKYVFSLCRNETIAEEIAQETFYKALKAIDKFDGKCHLFTWLCQIAKNTYFTYHQKQKRTTSDGEIEILQDVVHSFEQDIVDKDQARKLHFLLHQLPEPYKEVFSLRVFGELPFSQIGELFGKQDSWARLIYHRAKIELRRRLDENNM